MKGPIPLCCVFLSALGSVVAFATSSPAVVGGFTGNKEISSHIVAIVGSNGIVCTGTAIASDLVLTAAHCVMTDAKLDVFTLGAHVRDTSVVRSEQHPKFDFAAADSAQPTADAAILKTAEPLPSRIAPVALEARGSFPRSVRFIVAGFGSERDHEDGSFGKLGVARLTALHIRNPLQLRLIDPVTRGTRVGRSACSGDSGGPVFEQTKSGLAVVAIVSWGADVNGRPGCGGLTGAVPIRPVMTWIDETAQSLGSPVESIKGAADKGLRAQ